ncbi:MAG: 2-C-methyl-D-erythritol 4-phosphate cytidylyltransferase [Clostridia bacterium]|nr:2-C-methyl-D-erythritol 4-phosphate cytidylyltransferase [Clostridia bacterium]
MAKSNRSKKSAEQLTHEVAEVLYAAAGVPMPRKYTTAIIAAAGQSTRMGTGGSKQLLLLCGIPVLAHTLLAYERARSIHEIVVVCREQDIPVIRSIAEDYGIRKLQAVVRGGETRQESVLCGLRHISKKTQFVAIADGARCLTTPQQIEEICRVAYKTRAASAATPVTDTVKRADRYGRITETVDREQLYLAQTPQIFDFNLYHAAAYYALENKFSATDDNSLIEFINHPVRLVDCGRENIKITTPVDLIFAEAILRDRAAKQAATEEDR